MSCTISESVTLSSFFISFLKFCPFCVLGELTEVAEAELIEVFFEPIHLNIKCLHMDFTLLLRIFLIFCFLFNFTLLTAFDRRRFRN